MSPRRIAVRFLPVPTSIGLSTGRHTEAGVQARNKEDGRSPDLTQEHACCDGKLEPNAHVRSSHPETARHGRAVGSIQGDAHGPSSANSLAAFVKHRIALRRGDASLDNSRYNFQSHE
eukprot:756173-Hanusia_phi.AAC.1